MKSKFLFAVCILALILLFVGCSSKKDEVPASSEPVSIIDESTQAFKDVEADAVTIDKYREQADIIACDVFFDAFNSSVFSEAVFMNDKYYYTYEFGYDDDFMGRIAIAVDGSDYCIDTSNNLDYVPLKYEHDTWFIDDNSDNKFMDKDINNLYRMSKVIAYDVLGTFDDAADDGETDVNGVSCKVFSFALENSKIGSVAIAKDYSKYFYLPNYDGIQDYIETRKYNGLWMDYNGIEYTDVDPDAKYQTMADELAKANLGEYTDSYVGYSFKYMDGNNYFSYEYYNNSELLGVIAVSSDGGPSMIDYENDGVFDKFDI